MSTYETVLRVIQQADEYGEEGSAWLGHWNPDDAYLKCGELASAIADALREEQS